MDQTVVSATFVIPPVGDRLVAATGESSVVMVLLFNATLQGTACSLAMKLLIVPVTPAPEPLNSAVSVASAVK